MGVVLFFYGVVDFQGWLIFWQNRDTNKILYNGFEFINHIHIQSFQETYVCSTTHLEINDYTTKSKYYVKNISVFRKIRCINENHKVSMKCFFSFFKKWIFLSVLQINDYFATNCCVAKCLEPKKLFKWMHETMMHQHPNNYSIWFGDF